MSAGEGKGGIQSAEGSVSLPVLAAESSFQKKFGLLCFQAGFLKKSAKCGSSFGIRLLEMLPVKLPLLLN